MKKLVGFLVLFLFGAGFYSCDNIEKLADVPFNFKVTENIPVNIQAGTVNKAAVKDLILFSESVVLSIDNEDTHDYLNKIKEVQIKSLTYQFTGYSGAAEGVISAELYADNILLAGFEGSVKEASDAGTVFKIENTDDLNKVANRLKSGHQVEARLQGSASNPMYFILHIVMDVKVVANPL